MVEIYQYGDDLKALNRKRDDLVREGYKFERDMNDDLGGQAEADEKRKELTDAGLEIVILKTRGLMDIWSKQKNPESK